MGRPIAFLSDLGTRDEFVGVCHGVIEWLSPGSRVIDLSHGVPPQDVLAGAIVLANAVPYLPADAVVLAVVDPGSGTDRRAVALETEAGTALVGPDNGLLSLAWPRLGGIGLGVEISSPEVILPSASRVFDGRDVFAPAAAWLARGEPFEGLGPAVEESSLVAKGIVEPDVERHLVKGEALEVDRFGNVRLNVRPEHLERAELDGVGELRITTPAGSATAPRISTYHDVAEGRYGVLVDAWGWVSVVRYAASAADGLEVAPGELVWIAPATA